ncbi:MAG: peptidase domain-containing ABC transporter [Azonexus sp.]|nr:peptidase domain-containing ABC transporter [Betaproteobacteria bacterium]MBK8917627.1 peptidase domain-containing ABC transporter [Betaproteobacteria bacterium]MBP6037035.1 peptidase domain-containing ABC transporter [Azonexus sp.]MBP6907500.1 peptidase domain-containing ABC transporter [Azonexus sp.]
MPPASPNLPLAPCAPIDTASALWLLGSLTGYHRRPFDATLILRRFAPPLDVPALIEALEVLGLKAALVDWPADDWSHLPPPFVLFETRPDAEPQSQAPPVAAPESAADALQGAVLSATLVVKHSAHGLACVRPGQGNPVPLEKEALDTQCLPLILLVAEAEPPIGESTGAVAGAATPAAKSERPFGFSWFVPELLRHRTIWRDVLLASLAIQLVGLATPLFTQVIVDKVIAHQSESTLLVLGVALVVFMFFTSGMSWLRQYLILHTGARIDAVLGEKVLGHLLRLPLPYFELRPTGTLVARLHGVEQLREFISGAAVSLVLDLPFLVVFLAVMFAYSWQLTLIALGIMALIVTASLFMVPIFRQRLDTQFLLGARNQAFLTEYLAGMGTVKSLQLEPDIGKRYAGYLAQYLAAGFATKQVGNTYNVVANGLEQVMTLAILIVGAWLVMQPEAGMTVGMLVAFQMFASRMSQPMLRLVGLWQEFQQASISVKRLGDILDMPQEPVALTPQRAAGGEGRITLHDLGFRYTEQHPWLYRNLNLTLAVGKLTVLMGPSGCGKSTLAKLLQGFYWPQEGQITLDGRDIRQLAANQLRATFGVVPQETVLFSGTVYDNLVMAHPHASFEEVIAACRAAEIHDVIEKLPQGYQSEIGERGTGLSGGQRQRIAIARALLKRPRVLIFDEAISNLDQQTAEHFAHTINRLKGKVTMIFITHQVPRGLQVDEVVNMGQGGVHMSLVKEEH